MPIKRPFIVYFDQTEERVSSRFVKVLSFDTKPLAVNLLPVLKISRDLNRGEKNYLSRVTETVHCKHERHR